ncbi:MAG TPA: hypothetical protein VMJ34_08335 [Bryobacteraceae bacterium]|nr:hypothetical protein [Bryobacteraceae bacterium]
MLKTKLLAVVIGALFVFGMIALAQPERNISHHRHPNLAAAQQLCEQAYNRIEAAQQANEFDMDGHAKKAKELLEAASHELKEAALAANRNR